MMMPSNVHFERGEVLCELGRFVLAEQEFRQEIAVNPDFADAYALLGWCLLQQGKIEALTEIKHAISLCPEESNFHKILALYWYLSSQVDDAKTAINEAIRLDPYCAYYFFILACIQVDKSDRNMYSGNSKDIEEKESKFYASNVFPAIEQSLALDPHHIPALNLYTNSLAKVGRFGEAIENSRKTLEISPNDALTLKNHGMLLFEANKFAEASDYFHKALEIDPNLTEANNFLLRSKRRIRRLELERKFADEYTKLSQSEKDSIEASRRARNLELERKRSKKYNKHSKFNSFKYIRTIQVYSNYVLLLLIFFLSLFNTAVFVIWNINLFLILSVEILAVVLLFYFYNKNLDKKS